MNPFELAKPFWRLCLLRQGPQDLPASGSLLVLVLAVYFGVSVAIALPMYGSSLALTQALAETMLLGLFTRVILAIARRPNRWVQTFTALAGVGALLGLFVLPLVHVLAPAGDEPGTLEGLASLVYLGLIGWLLAAYGHVFRHALSLRGLAPGVLLALAYVFLSAIVVELLLPAGIAQSGLVQ
ncbi:MAG: hypothetical protein RBT51_05260 [Ectothiorhodospiraceae bacterium]|jgi:hypothetical protein|nr:hypothetical protein [Ectothiorhodospiraceae bacterium]